MTEEEMKELVTDQAVLKYVNNNMGTDYTLEQKDATVNKIALKRGNLTVRCGNLREISIHIAGMLDLAYVAGGRKA